MVLPCLTRLINSDFTIAFRPPQPQRRASCNLSASHPRGGVTRKTVTMVWPYSTWVMISTYLDICYKTPILQYSTYTVKRAQCHAEGGPKRGTNRAHSPSVGRTRAVLGCAEEPHALHEGRTARADEIADRRIHTHLVTTIHKSFYLQPLLRTYLSHRARRASPVSPPRACPPLMSVACPFPNTNSSSFSHLSHLSHLLSVFCHLILPVYLL